MQYIRYTFWLVIFQKKSFTNTKRKNAMRIILFLCFTLSYPLGYAKDKNICLLDDLLKNTTEYKNYLLSDEENTIELEKNELSLLPDIFINSSQNSNNDRSFRSVENSGLSIGFSQGIYSGG
ncbi:hypothetical protein FEQ65_005073, partial [Shigella sonnei]|nr:hypothetical protein [Shigella sonnei]